jgi:hypothetical protein
VSPEEQREEEGLAIERERLAFERRQAAWMTVHRQFLPFGNGQPTNESLAEFDAAEKEWRRAQADMDRIGEEIRTGKRR